MLTRVIAYMLQPMDQLVEQPQLEFVLPRIPVERSGWFRRGRRVPRIIAAVDVVADSPSTPLKEVRLEFLPHPDHGPLPGAVINPFWLIQVVRVPGAAETYEQRTADA